jgi:hypothetical protein
VVLVRGLPHALGHDHDDPRWRPTLVSEAKFLRNHDVAEWIWNNEVHWDDYAGDVERAKTKLENILMTSGHSCGSTRRLW